MVAIRVKAEINRTNPPLCILSIGWRCCAAAARLEEFNPLDMASAGLRITGIELLMLLKFLSVS